MIDLQKVGINPKKLGGDVPCVSISAKEKSNLEELQQEILEVAKSLDLVDDILYPAQCFVIESYFDD